nr:hypothetical protein [Tanacetum cinerariifolium]
MDGEGCALHHWVHNVMSSILGFNYNSNSNSCRDVAVLSAGGTTFGTGFELDGSLLWVGGIFVNPRLQPIRDLDLRVFWSFFIAAPPAASTWQLPIGQPPVTWQPRQHRSTPVNDGQCRRQPSVNDGQRRRQPSVNDGQRRRPPTVNAAGHRSTASDHGGDRRSTVAVNDGRRWRPPLTAAGPPLTTTGQRWLVGWSKSGSGPVWAGSGSGLGRVRHVCTRVRHVCPRGIHVAADVDIEQQEGVEPGTSWLES